MKTDLTVREAHVLRLLAQGSTDKAIAAKIGYSPQSVKNVVAHVRRKVGGAPTRVTLALLYVKTLPSRERDAFLSSVLNSRN